MAFLRKKSDTAPPAAEEGATTAGTASGMAKLKFNAHPLEVNLLTYKKKGRESNLLPVLLLVLFLLIGATMGYYYKLGLDDLNGLNSQKIQMQAEKERLQKESGFSADYQNLQAQLNAKQANVQALQAQKVHFSKVINTIASVIPSGVTLTGMKLSQGTAGLAGFAGEYGQVAVFIAGLRDKPMFKHVTLVTCGKGASNTQIQFTIDVGWEETKP